MIQPGERFAYYRGVHRKDGTRGDMEYFGIGLIGDVWLDPDTEDETAARRNWYCAIEDYIPFAEPVLAKQNDYSIETVKHEKNHWRRAVRQLPEVQFDEIVTNAKLRAVVEQEIQQAADIIRIVEEEAIPTSGKVRKPRQQRRGDHGASSPRRSYSKKSKLVGDAGECAVFKHLQNTILGIQSLRWLAQEGETPGWDIEYVDQDGNTVRVEVKGSESRWIKSVELTANEWAAAEAHGSSYHLALVGSCLSAEPVIEFLIDPFEQAVRDDLAVKPVRFEISW
jgi:hypothetical protein